MGFPSFPPSGRVVSLIEVLPLMGLVVVLEYGSSDITRREERTYTGG